MTDDAIIKRVEAAVAKSPKMKQRVAAATKVKAKANGNGHDVQATAAASGRTQIKLIQEHWNRMLGQCAALLTDTVYMRGIMPMMLARATDIGGRLTEDKDGPAVELSGVRHQPGSLLFMEASGGRVAWSLDGRATFWRYVRREDEWVAQHCPKEVAAALVEAAVYQEFLPCAGIVHVPLLVDGKLVCESGYHRGTKLILDLTDRPPSIPRVLSKEVAQKALERLLRPFRGFIEQGGVSRTALAAAILTAVLRPSMPTAPMLLIDGNAPGCGKGKLARALSALGTGSLPAVVTEGHSEEEMEKRIASAVLQGAQAILLDNLQRLLASSTLESMLTEPVADIRGFGSLELLRVACRALVLCTANNAAIRVDLLRRSLPLRIVVTTENPELRRFGFDPVEEVLRDRVELLSAAFTVALAWHQARDLEENQPHRLEFGSFEVWGDLVAGAVSWLTDENPIGLIEQRKERDGNVSNERAVVQALYEWQAMECPGPRITPWYAKAAASGVDADLWVAVLPKHKEGTPPAHKSRHLAAEQARHGAGRQGRAQRRQGPQGRRPMAHRPDRPRLECWGVPVPILTRRVRFGRRQIMQYGVLQTQAPPSIPAPLHSTSWPTP